MNEKLNIEDLQAELGRLQGIETFWNATLAVLRRIDDEMPASAKLPGSPALEDVAYHLLTEYKQREAEIVALRAKMARLEAALDEIIHMDTEQTLVLRLTALGALEIIKRG